MNYCTRRYLLEGASWSNIIWPLRSGPSVEEEASANRNVPFVEVVRITAFITLQNFWLDFWNTSYIRNSMVVPTRWRMASHVLRLDMTYGLVPDFWVMCLSGLSFPYRLVALCSLSVSSQKWLVKESCKFVSPEGKPHKNQFGNCLISSFCVDYCKFASCWALLDWTVQRSHLSPEGIHQ